MKFNNVVSTTPKVLILAIHGPYEPWVSILRHGQLRTWMKDSQLPIVNVFGRGMNAHRYEFDEKLYFLRWNKSKAVSYFCLIVEAAIKVICKMNKYQPRVTEDAQGEFGNTWIVDMPDSLLLQGVKNVATLRHSLQFDYDYLVTTISSSYIDTECLIRKLQEAPKSKFLGGRIESSGGEFYQQGSFRVFSRDVIEYIDKNFKLYKHWQIEDIAMGNLVRKYSSTFTELPNLSLKSINDASNVPNDQIGETCSYRCKSVTSSGERLDSKLMFVIHEKLNLRS